MLEVRADLLRGGHVQQPVVRLRALGGHLHNSALGRSCLPLRGALTRFARRGAANSHFFSLKTDFVPDFS